MEGGLLAGELVEEDVDAPDEHAGVPQVFAGLDVGPGEREGGLLLEGGDLADVVGAGGLADVEVAVAGLGVGRGDADGHQQAVLGAADRRPQHGREGGDVADQLVGGEGTHDGVRVAAGDDRRGEADGGARVAGVGSTRMLPSGRPGSCRATAAACATPVTTNVVSGVARSLRRPYVAWSSDNGVPVSAWRNFG